MPGCYRCGRGQQASAEVRRTSFGHVCKDRLQCERRIRKLAAMLALAQRWAKRARRVVEAAA